MLIRNTSIWENFWNTVEYCRIPRSSGDARMVVYTINNIFSDVFKKRPRASQQNWQSAIASNAHTTKRTRNMLPSRLGLQQTPKARTRDGGHVRRGTRVARRARRHARGARLRGWVIVEFHALTEYCVFVACLEYVEYVFRL